MLDCLFSYAVFKTGVRTSLYFYKRAASFKNGWVYVLKHSLLFAPVQGVGNNISKSQIGLHTCTNFRDKIVNITYYEPASQ